MHGRMRMAGTGVEDDDDRGEGGTWVEQLRGRGRVEEVEEERLEEAREEQLDGCLGRRVGGQMCSGMVGWMSKSASWVVLRGQGSRTGEENDQPGG